METLSRFFEDFPAQGQIREDALLAGGQDPASFLFRIAEYNKHNGELLGIAGANLSFSDALTRTVNLIRERENSHFCLEPAGRVQ